MLLINSFSVCHHCYHHLKFNHTIYTYNHLCFKIPRANHASSLCQLLRLLTDLLSGQKSQVQRVQGHVLYDLINTLLIKLATAMKKAKVRLFCFAFHTIFFHYKTIWCLSCKIYQDTKLLMTQENNIYLFPKLVWCNLQGNIEKILEDIRRRWDNAEFKSSLLSYLEQGSGTEIPPG